MTTLGSLIFSAIGALFVAGVAAMIWLATRDSSAVIDGLTQAGWTIDRPAGGPTRWIAKRTDGAKTLVVDVSASGMKNKSVWTSVHGAAETATDDVLLTPKMPGFLAADGSLLAAFGATPPPRWSGAPEVLLADCDVFASDASAAARWLTDGNQRAVLDFNRTHRKVSVRFAQGRIEVRWAEAPRSVEQITDAVALVVALSGATR